MRQQHRSSLPSPDQPLINADERRFNNSAYQRSSAFIGGSNSFSTAISVKHPRIELGEVAPRAKVLRVETSESKELDVSEADVIVSGGRGIKGPEGWPVIRDLQGALGAALYAHERARAREGEEEEEEEEEEIVPRILFRGEEDYMYQEEMAGRSMEQEEREGEEGEREGKAGRKGSKRAGKGKAEGGKGERAPGESKRKSAT